DRNVTGVQTCVLPISIGGLPAGPSDKRLPGAAPMCLTGTDGKRLPLARVRGAAAHGEDLIRRMESSHMAERRIGIIVNGATGRMGYRQHLVRSLLAIQEQGGVELA